MHNLAQLLKINITTLKESGLTFILGQGMGSIHVISVIDKAVLPKIADDFFHTEFGSAHNYSCSNSHCEQHTISILL